MHLITLNIVAFLLFGATAALPVGRPLAGDQLLSARTNDGSGMLFGREVVGLFRRADPTPKSPTPDPTTSNTRAPGKKPVGLTLRTDLDKTPIPAGKQLTSFPVPQSPALRSEPGTPVVDASKTNVQNWQRKLPTQDLSNPNNIPPTPKTPWSPPLTSGVSDSVSQRGLISNPGTSSAIFTAGDWVKHQQQVNYRGSVDSAIGSTFSLNSPNTPNTGKEKR